MSPGRERNVLFLGHLFKKHLTLIASYRSLVARVKFFDIVVENSFSKEDAMASLKPQKLRNLRIEIENAIEKLFNRASDDFADFFEQQRRDYGKAQRLFADVRAASHEVFDFLEEGDLQEAQLRYMECEKAYEDLIDPDEINIPGRLLTQIKNDAGQELTEAHLGIPLYSVLTGEIEISEIPSIIIKSCDELNVTPQAWLGGAADVASEMGKLAKGIWSLQVCYGPLKISKEELCERRLAIARGIKKTLARFARCYPLIVSATHRFGQGFSQKRRQVSGSILRTMDDIFSLEYIADFEPLES